MKASYNMSAQTLNDRMEFGHVIRVSIDGAITDEWDLHAPETVYQTLDGDGQCIDDEIHFLPKGWTLLTGFTGQYSYNGPVMHASEFIGGDLERHILSNPGLYVAVVVDGLRTEETDDDDNIGWAVAYKESDG